MSRIPEDFFKVSLRMELGTSPPQLIPVSQLKITTGLGKELILERHAHHFIFGKHDDIAVRVSTHCAYDPATNTLYYYVSPTEQE